MGLFDFLGPTALTKRRGWDALPAPLAERKSIAQPTGGFVDSLNAAFTLTTMLYAPGAGYGYGTTNDQAAGNSAVRACLESVASAIGEPELKVYRVGPGERVELEQTPLGALLARPNPVFSLDALLGYLSDCLHVNGNAYWRKLRAGDPETGNVVELWPISPRLVEPVTDDGSDEFISRYRYYESSARPVDLSPANVVHFRYGIDDRDHRLGFSPLRRLVREISSDEQATRYADRLLANLAVNGLTLSFDKDAPAISQEQADELKARIIAAYGGDNAGSAAVLSPGAQLTALGFSPEQMDMKTLHRVPEERIAAVLGVPAVVAGLGAGLDRSTYANVREAREMFTEAKLIPLWKAIASVLTIQLVPDFAADASTVVDFDLSEIRALADDQNALATRLETLVASGILSVDEARAELGYEPAPAPAPLTAPTPVPSAASRRNLRAVTVPEQKAAEDLPGRFSDLSSESLPTWESELIAFFEQQLRRVTRRLQAGADTAESLVTEGEAILLGETLTPLQLSTLRSVERVVAAELGVAFTVDDAGTRRYLQSAGANIGGITETTRQAVADALVEGQMLGEGIPQLARRLAGLPAFGLARGRVVARTELGTSQNLSAVASYRASGVVVGLRVHDGDYDAACAAMNGRTFSLDQAPPPLQHPNCTRALAPVTDAAELSRSA